METLDTAIAPEICEELFSVDRYGSALTSSVWLPLSHCMYESARSLYPVMIIVDVEAKYVDIGACIRMNVGMDWMW